LFQAASAQVKGNLFILGAMASWALYTLLNKSFQSKYSGLSVTAWQNLCGTVLLLPLSFTEVREWRLLSVPVVANIVYLAVFCSVVCYLLYSYALRKLDVAVTTMYLNLVPVIGTLGGTLILKETVTYALTSEASHSSSCLIRICHDCCLMASYLYNEWDQTESTRKKKFFRSWK
jgi:drug/metabolite transporter (DMT)-like permease